MKKILLLFILLLNLTRLVAKEGPGYYINRSGDTLKRTFKIYVEVFSKEINLRGMQCGVEFYDAQGKKQRLSPDTIKEIGFEFEGIKYKMVSFNNNLGMCECMNGSRLFLHQICQGSLQLFKYYIKTQSGNSWGGGGTTSNTSMMSHEVYILHKEGELLHKVDKFFFKKDLAEYFADCPALVNKIENKIYKMDDMDKIVEDYNQNCLKK